MNKDTLVTLIAIVGVILLSGAGIVVYGVDGKDVTMQAISGLMGFAGGAGVGGAMGYTLANKEGE
jgi:hypothetical protein